MSQQPHYPWGNAAQTQQHAAFQAGYEQVSTPPSSPNLLAAHVYQNCHVALQWGEAKGADGYIILRGSQPNTMQPIAAVAERAFVDTTTQPGRTYYYCVSGYNQHGKSRPCDYAAVALPTAACATPYEAPCGMSTSPHHSAASEASSLQAPTGLRAFAHGSRYIALHWQPLYSGVEYRVFRSETPWSSYAVVGETGETHYLDAVPEPMTKYYYFVQAVCNGHSSQASTMAEGESFPTLPAPETPQNLRCTAQENDAVELSWNHTRAAAAYVVYARFDQAGEFSVIGHTLDCTYLHENVPQDSYVEYRVQAYHDSAASEPSAVCGSRSNQSARKCGTQKRYPNLSWQGFK